MPAEAAAGEAAAQQPLAVADPAVFPEAEAAAGAAPLQAEQQVQVEQEAAA
jgi:hypothetical protein